MKGDHRDRDRMLEQALTHELRPTGSAPMTDVCLDAETLSAWMDGGLDPASLAAAEAHAANCARCQALIATMAKTVPADLAGGSTSVRLWRWWLAPLAAGAAAVTLWMVVPQQPIQPVLEPVPAPATVARDAAPSPPAADAQEKLAESKKSAADSRAATANRDRLQARKQDAGTRRDAAADSVMAEARVEPKAAREATVGRAAATPPAAAAVAAEAPATLQRQMKQAFTLEIVSSDQSRRWRVLDGAVQRSTDGGGTWTAVRTLTDEQLIAGASPSPNVCWLVGRNGLILLTTDGRAFNRIAFAEAVDLAGVSAQDARNAIVTASDGRRFQTADSGRTWRQP